VKAKLALEKLPIQGVLTVWILPHAESALNLPESFKQEGHLVEVLPPEGEDKQVLNITRCG
jgi:hypothetical protein